MKDKRSKYNRNYAISIVFTLFISNLVFCQATESSRPSIKTVVIDAGHGGKDPGCHGSSAQEKNVCLSIALKLGALIKKKYPQIKVIYTRETDVFVELDERAKIANRNKADLFICIHANAAGETVFGVETYVLGLHKTEAQQLIAERENATIYLEEDKGAKYKDFDLSPDALIARQIQLSVFLNQSISFASKIQTEIKKIGRYDRGVKQAGFLVLYKTTMPSVLIETGFLSNRSEEKFLNETTNQMKMSTSMFNAFELYLNELEWTGNELNTGVYSPIKNDPFVQDEKALEKVVVKTIDKTKVVIPVLKPVVKSEVISEVKKEVLITAPNSVKKEEKVELISDKNKVIFRVQITTSDKKVNLTDERFKKLEVYEYQHDAVYKYTAGKFDKDYKSASKYKNELKINGFPSAFVVAFLNGERIILEKALKLAEK